MYYVPAFHFLSLTLSHILSFRTGGDQEPPVPPAAIQSIGSAGNRYRAGVFSIWIPNSKHTMEERRGTDPELVRLILEQSEMIKLTRLNLSVLSIK